MPGPLNLEVGQTATRQTTVTPEHIAKYAEISGALGIRVTRKAELDDALERALAHDGPALVEVLTDVELI